MSLAPYAFLFFLISTSSGGIRQHAAADDTKPYVEIDFSTLPRDGVGECAYTVTILTTDKDIKYSTESKGPKKFAADAVCESWAINMRVNRYKVEIVDKTKLRIFGRMFNDELIPATEGTVESKDLKPDQLPKVKNPPKA